MRDDGASEVISFDVVNLKLNCALHTPAMFDETVVKHAKMAQFYGTSHECPKEHSRPALAVPKVMYRTGWSLRDFARTAQPNGPHDPWYRIDCLENMIKNLISSCRII